MNLIKEIYVAIMSFIIDGYTKDLSKPAKLILLVPLITLGLSVTVCTAIVSLYLLIKFKLTKPNESKLKRVPQPSY